MFKQKRLAALSMAVLLALLVAAVMPFAVLADDATPPPAAQDAPVVVDPPVDGAVPSKPVAAPSVDAAPTVDAVPPVVVAAPTVDTIAPPANTASAVDVAPTTVPAILEQLPADTGLVVVNQGGATLPLASNDAAAVLAAPDPYFTVAGTIYQFTATDCDPLLGAPVACDDPIQAAVDYLANNKYTPDDGNIYVQSGTYNPDPSSGGLTINGSAWVTDPLVDKYPGNLGLVGTGSGTTIYNGSLNVFLSNNFTLSGFTFNDHVMVIGDNNVNLNDVVVNGNKSSTGGIDIETYGNVALNNVTSVQSSNDGAQVYSNGDVSVTNSRFNDNTQSGLNVNSLGDVTLNDVTANSNGGSGLSVRTLAGDITLSDAVANGNSGTGVEAVTLLDGDITVNGGEFSSNGSGEDDGLRLLSLTGNLVLNDATVTDNKGGGFLGRANGTITVNGGNFSGNTFEGINVFADGGVILDHVTVSGNKRDGVYAGTYGADINILCGSYTGNGGYGLQLDPMDGNVNLGGPVFTGNHEGEYNLLSSGLVSFGECPKPVPPIQEDPLPSTENNESDSLLIPATGRICDGERKVALDIGTGIGIFTNLCDVVFQLQEAKNDTLPGVLPNGISYVVGMDAQMSIDGKALDELPVGRKITLKFPIPAGTDAAKLSVLFWNGSEWVKVTGGKVVDGFYVVQVDHPGSYVLTAQ